MIVYVLNYSVSVNPYDATGIFILLAVLVVAGFDLFMYLRYGVSTTISDVTRNFNRKWPLLAPIIAFAMGCLYGHLFLH